MRELKFRAYDLKWERWVEPEDITIHGDGTIFVVRRGEPGRFNPGDEIETCQDPKEIKIVQYTGLNDATKWEELTEDERTQWTRDGNFPSDWKGKLIYEDYILKHDDGDIGKVEDAGGYWEVASSSSFVMLGGISDQYKIIGTMQENPELLKVKEKIK